MNWSICVLNSSSLCSFLSLIGKDSWRAIEGGGWNYFFWPSIYLLILKKSKEERGLCELMGRRVWFWVGPMYFPWILIEAKDVEVISFIISHIK